MNAKERQLEIVTGMIRRSPVGMTLDAVSQVSDETLDTNRYTISCTCNDTILITLEENQEGFWVMKTLDALRSHVQLKHGEQMPVDSSQNI
jgi:hypothetical protein